MSEVMFDAVASGFTVDVCEHSDTDGVRSSFEVHMVRPKSPEPPALKDVLLSSFFVLVAFVLFGTAFLALSFQGWGVVAWLCVVALGIFFLLKGVRGLATCFQIWNDIADYKALCVERSIGIRKGGVYRWCGEEVVAPRDGLFYCFSWYEEVPQQVDSLVLLELQGDPIGFKREEAFYLRVMITLKDTVPPTKAAKAVVREEVRRMGRAYMQVFHRLTYCVEEPDPDQVHRRVLAPFVAKVEAFSDVEKVTGCTCQSGVFTLSFRG